MKKLALLGATSLVLALSACGTGAAGSGSSDPETSGGESAKKVAALFTQTTDQGNWDVAGGEAYDAMCEAESFDCTKVEQATYEQAPQLLRGYGEQGYAMVVGHSSGFAAAMKEVAPEFPDTQFVVYSYESDTEDIANYSAWSVDWDQVGYLQGIIAGLASKSGKITAFGGEQIPSTERTMALMEKGAQSVNPKAKIGKVWIGSFTDVAKGKQVAEQAINGGTDFLIPMADSAGAGVQQASEAAGTQSLGEYLDESDKYPKGAITSIVVDMKTSYAQIGEQLTAGKLGNEIVALDASTDVLSFAPFKHIDAAIQEQAETALAGLKDGSVKVPAV